MVNAINDSVRARLDIVEVFSELGSTSSYLLSQAGPEPGHCRIALADQQTAGRGRMGKVWQSPRSSGLYLSAAYTFARMPRNFSCLTLAVGVGVTAALSDVGANGVELKWPNDLVLKNGKLGGILTELQSVKRGSESVTVIIGIGLNLDMQGQLAGVTAGIGQISDLRQVMTELPGRFQIAAAIIEHLVHTLLKFDDDGFSSFSEQWKRFDWLAGKNIRVETPFGNIDGIASGIDEDGALVVQRDGARERVISGTVTLLPTNSRQAGTGND